MGLITRTLGVSYAEMLPEHKLFTSYPFSKLTLDSIVVIWKR